MPGLQSSTTEPGTWFILHQDPGPELPLLAAQQSEDPPPEQSGPIWSHNRTANERCNYPGYNKVSGLNMTILVVVIITRY